MVHFDEREFELRKVLAVGAVFRRWLDRFAVDQLGASRFVEHNDLAPSVVRVERDELRGSMIVAKESASISPRR